MKLSRTVAYALQASLYIAGHSSGVPIPCSRLAAEGKMPERFLLQILRNLVAHGVLVSARGVDGGYVLDRPPSEISLLDIIEAINGPLVPVLPISDDLSSVPIMQLKKAFADVTKKSRRQLAAIKLSQLLA